MCVIDKMIEMLYDVEYFWKAFLRREKNSAVRFSVCEQRISSTVA